MKSFLESLDTDGGHIAISLLLVLLIAVLDRITGTSTAEGHDILVFALGVLARSMNASTGKISIK